MDANEAPNGDNDNESVFMYYWASVSEVATVVASLYQHPADRSCSDPQETQTS